MGTYDNLKRVIFEYENGMSVIREGDALKEWLLDQQGMMKLATKALIDLMESGNQQAASAPVPNYDTEFPSLLDALKNLVEEDGKGN